jgi:hypothetical protein
VLLIGSYFAGKNVRFDMLCDGDDALVFVDLEDISVMDGFADYCQALGFKMEISEPKINVCEIEFCQSRPIEIVPGKHVMVRNPKRAISRAGMSHTSMASIPEALQTLWAIGACELALHVGVPVMQEFALWALRNGVKPSAKKFDQMRYRLSHQYWDLPKAHDPLPVTPSARAAFAEAWGVSPAEQLLCEKHFREHNFQLEKKVMAPEPVDTGAGLVYVAGFKVYT